MNCFRCSTFNGNVQLLTCGHFCCPECYVALNCERNPFCWICSKKLKRGNKKNKIEIN